MSKIKELKVLTQNFSLLYVEDNKILRETTSTLFRDLFKSVMVAEDGVQALEMYEKYFDDNTSYFDIVISDIQMPQMDGITLSKELFKINSIQKILIISAHNETKYFLDLINIGISGFIQKPLNSKQILSILFDTCNTLAQERELLRFFSLPKNFVWDFKNKNLTQEETIIKLSDTEKVLLEFFILHTDQKFTSLEIFDYLYANQPEKKFSQDSIKSLIKRLRKKIPHNFIANSPQSGYYFNTTLL